MTVASVPPWGGVRAMAVSVAAGVVTGLLAVTSALSLASLIFAGPLAPFQPDGVAAVLIGTAVVAAIVALTSSIPFAVAGPDSGSAAVLAVLAAEVARSLGGAASAATVGIALAMASLVAGAILVVLGALRLGRVVRFVPYPVVAGFLAASGLVLISGSLRLSAVVPDWDSATAFAFAWPRLAVSTAVAVLLLVLAPRTNHAAALLALLAVVALAHHAVFAMLGWGPEQAAARGWLMHAPGGALPPRPWAAATLAQVDWPLLWRHAADFATVGLIAALTIMLSVSVLEVGTGQDADIDRELMAGGVANLLSGLAGGMPGTLSSARTTLVWRAGGRGRLTGLTLAACAGLALLEGEALARAMPTTVIAGMLGYMGLDTVRNWLITPRRRLGTTHWVSSVLIALIILQFGFVMGVAAGLLLGCVSFAVSYSRIPAARLQYDGATARSRVQRSPAETAALAAAAGRLLVIHLQGYLFFGTASLLVGRIRRALARPTPPGVLILDCAAVDDVDSAAITSLLRLHQVTVRAGVTLVLAGLAPALRLRLAAAQMVPQVGLLLPASLDEALEWYEDGVLGDSAEAAAPAGGAAALFAGQALPAGALPAFLRCLQPMALSAGAVLMRQGEASDDLFLVESGRLSVRVQRGDGPQVRARSFGPGSMVGELAFHLGAARTATVVADRPSRVWRLTRAALTALEREQPAVAIAFQRGMVRLLSQRLTELNAVYNALIEPPAA